MPAPTLASPSLPVPAAQAASATPEMLVIAKQLAELFQERGVPIHYRYARALITQCPQSVHGRYVKFSDAWAWWTQNPTFRPFAEKKAKPAKPRALRVRSSYAA